MKIFPQYFEDYGGLNSVVKSPYFYAASLMTAVCYKFFLQEGWWEMPIGILPDILGFSIAGVAVFIGLGNDKLRSLLAGKNEGDCDNSAFLDFMAMFTHFVVLQIISLIFSLIAKALYSSPPPIKFISDISDSFKDYFWIFCGFLFFYAVLLCVAVAVEIYRLARMIDAFQTEENQGTI